MPASMGVTNLILLPKSANANKLTERRPISLCTFHSKLVSRVLNDRLASILPKRISPEQSGFITGRSIHESIALAHEMASELNRRVHGGNMLIWICLRHMIG